MLQLSKHGVVTTISGYHLGRYIDDDWIPNQCLIGSDIDDSVLARLSGCQVVDGILISFSRPIARLSRSLDGLIQDLELIPASPGMAENTF